MPASPQHTSPQAVTPQAVTAQTPSGGFTPPVVYPPPAYAPPSYAPSDPTTVYRTDSNPVVAPEAADITRRGEAAHEPRGEQTDDTRSHPGRADASWPPPPGPWSSGRTARES